jgi:DNA (cytosine-5)-methyltransferase 1
MLTSRGLGTVLADLAKMGFDAKWGVLGAADVGAPHQRDRIWILATNTDSKRWNNRISDWEKRQLLHDKNRNATQNKSEWQGWVSRSRQISSDVADTTQLQRDGGNDNARVSMESCSESEFGNNSWQNNVADTDSTQCKGNERTKRSIEKRAEIGESSWWKTEPDVGRVADGVAARVDRLKAIGNGQVPLCAATAWRILNAS